MGQKITAEEIGKELAEVILQWCAPNEINGFRKKFNIEKDIETFNRELFYLFMFLMTYVCQRVFTENKEFTERLLDAFHKYVYEKKLDLPAQLLNLTKLEEQIRNRYAQYYKLTENEPKFLIRQLPYDFLGNVSGKKIEDLTGIEEFKKEFSKRWGKTILEMQLWVGYLLKDMIDYMTDIKRKYKIGI
ncbi:MAG: hypothetical protein QMD08_06455 [Actinomycetota bacterium]|nr:hypothetical protein [Actinomycetota bacterium]